MNEEEIQRFTDQLRLTTEELDEFTRSLKVLNPTLSKVLDPLGKFNEELKQSAASTKNNSEALKADTEATRTNTKAVEQNKHVIEALTDAQEELEVSTSALKSAMSSAGAGIIKTATAFGDALLKNEEGATKYGTAVGKAGDAALEIGSKFGILGTIIGGLIKAGTAVMEAQFKQADMQRKAITDLSKLGAAGEFTSKEILELAHSASVPIERFNEIAGPLKSMGTGIIALGDSAGESTREFAKLANVSADTRKGFFRLGVSFPELTQNMADYVAMQKMSGRVITQQAKDSGELQKAALKYTLTLQELSDLTGLSVEESKKQLAATTNTIQMTIINAQRAEELASLEERKKTATGEELEQIQKAIDLHKTQQEALDKANVAMAAIGGGGKEAGAALQQFLVKGSLSPEAARKFSQLGIDLDKYRQQYLKGEFDTAAFMQEYQKKVRDRVKTAGDGVIQSGEDAERLAKELGISQEEVVWAMGNMGKDFDKASKDVAQKQADALSGQGKMAEDAMTENLANLSEGERQAQILKEKALDATNVLYNKVVPEMTTAAEKLTDLFNMLASAVGALLAATGIGAAVKGAQAAAKAFGKVKDYLSKPKAPPVPPAAPTTPPSPAPTPVGKDGKPLRGAALKSAQEKAARLASEEATKKAAEEASKKAAQEAAEAAAKKSAGGMAGKAAGALGKAAGAVGKFAKFVPGVGTAITAGLALKGGFDAAGRAEDVLELEQGKKATTGQKVAAGAAGALSSLSFGLLDEKNVGGFLNKTLGLGETDEDQAKREQKEFEKAAGLQKEDKARQDLTAELRKSASPLQKFSKDLGSTKDPIKEFRDNIEKINRSMSGTAATGESKAQDSVPDFNNILKMAGNLGIDAKEIQSAMTSGASGSTIQKALSQMSKNSALSTGPSRIGPPQTQSQPKAAASSAPSGGGFFTGVGQMLDSGIGFARDAIFGSDDKPPEKEKTTGGGGSMSEQDIKNMIVEHEGIRYTPYKDSLGLWTVGVGHLIGDGRSLPSAWNREFSHEEVMNLFDKDYEHHRQAAEKIPGFNNLDSMGQGALTDLTFNMGPVWYRKWPRFSKAMEEGDTQLAALSLEQSKWYGQVGRRAPKIVSMVENAKVSAREGGIAKGPESGYPAKLHGNEIIVPLDPNSILAELGKKSAQQIASDMQQKAPDIKSSDQNGMKDLLNMNQALMELLSGKLDNMINKLDTSNDVQTKILKYTQA